MRFSYKKFQLKDGTELLKPIIPIGLLYNRRYVRYEALIDSGADFNIFNGEIGEVLGIDVRSGDKLKFGGISGTPFEVYLHSLNLKIGKWQQRVKAGFSYKISSHGFGILGQKGFFDLFEIKFSLSKGIIEITTEEK